MLSDWPPALHTNAELNKPILSTHINSSYDVSWRAASAGLSLTSARKVTSFVTKLFFEIKSQKLATLASDYDKMHDMVHEERVNNAGD